jgi:diguanylate cyclase (GGDEF)-like protein/PAS domain S-box-containing protein
MVNTTLSLTSGLGYGGMIHAFKNYVIRGDDKYLISLQKELSHVDEQIDFIQKNLPSYIDQSLLKDIAQAVDNYREKAFQVKELHLNNISVENIDLQVKVDDSKAFIALDKLRKRALELAVFMRSTTRKSMDDANQFHFYGLLLIIPLLIVAVVLYVTINKLSQFTLAIQKSSRWVDTLLDASPDATVIVNEEGIITRVNKASADFFGYQQHEFIGMEIEQLIPEGYRAQHIQHRKNHKYTKTHGPMKVNKRELKALTKDAKNIDVEINLNTPTIEGNVFAIATLRDISERLESEGKIIHQANYDMLTGLPNRFLAMDRLSQKIIKAKRSQKIVAVLFIDLDDFKKINDTLGHEAGDEILISLAKRIQKKTRESDTIARLGGDEFVVILDNIEHEQDIERTATNILSCCRESFRTGKRNLILTVSIGIACYPKDGDNISQLLRNADTAMYKSKELGRNLSTFYTSNMNTKVARQLEIEEQIHLALERNELSVVYQPKIELSSGKVVGVEALLRWYNPILGHVPPDEFIPIAEHTGIIIPIGHYVLINSLALLKYLDTQHHQHLHVAVNFSPIQFRDPKLAENLQSALEKSGIESHRLELEITEGVLLSGHNFVNTALTDIKTLGISIAMDDFGTGYSSLNYLRKYPFNILKIDKSFIDDIESNIADKKLVCAAILMAHALGLKVVAEGVETQQQLDILTENSCDIIQGYFYSKPLTQSALIEFLNS